MQAITWAILVSGAFLATTNANRHVMINENRTPKNSEWPIADATGGSVCDRCKKVIDKFDKDLEDPKIYEQIKQMLHSVCYQTSHPVECIVIVDEALAYFRAMDPTEKNPEKVCKFLHFCSDAKLEYFERINMLYGKIVGTDTKITEQMLCEECQFAVQEMSKYIQKRDLQEKIKKTFENFCNKLGTYAGKCDLVVEEFLPEMFEEIERLLARPKELCVRLHMCHHEQAEVGKKLLESGDGTPLIDPIGY